MPDTMRMPPEPHGMGSSSLDRDDDHLNSRSTTKGSKVDASSNHWPGCIVWTWIPGCTQCTVGIVGHMGIGKSNGELWEFLGDGASRAPQSGGLAFGPILRYVQLDERRVRRGTWDEGIENTIKKWRGRMHGACISNCHSFVADCLHEMRYAGIPCWNWLSYLLAIWIFIGGRFSSGSRALLFFVPIIVVAIVVFAMSSSGKSS
eukprot:TRINITY_DN27986_c0_g1_i1.p1 TRINITY_DN27986_c0_g1~~TRINITY_DN27986_c0_g1_i1.p1  ORF type:complete len:220 (+),score=21.86 TRINITY_DN27986_c0_g1_i1:49-660(+)